MRIRPTVIAHVVLLTVGATLAGCPSRTPPAPSYADVRIDDVPFERQKPDFCGEACTSMWLRSLGKTVDQDFVFDHTGLDPRQARGAFTKELIVALETLGFVVGDGWYKVQRKRAGEQLKVQFEALHADLEAGVPSIVCMRYSDNKGTPEHFRLVLGYDAKTDEVLYHEPAEDDGAYRRMARAAFLDLWPLKYSSDEWSVIRLRLEPGELAETRVDTTFTNADYTQHMIELLPKVPDGFIVLVEPPFVVIGDEAPEYVASRAENTVRWATRMLEQDYFAKEPAEILDIWLFKDEDSYLEHNLTLWGEEPGTPYGYYSSKHGALVMNIATGGGTLVHEIVHPFVAANIPDCPAWINEGLGSLYEQCGEEDGHIHGYVNWRLPGLHEAIRAGILPTIAELAAQSDDQFYGPGSGTHYAMARYLLYYLQQQDRLRPFVRSFMEHQAEDPTGYETLQEILGRPDMVKFQKDWMAFVQTLRWPPKIEVEAG